MDLSRARAEIMAPIKQRVSRLVAQRLDDKAVLQLVLACSLREPEDLLGFMFNKNVAREAFANREELALTNEEWACLFHRDNSPVRDGGVLAVVQSNEFRSSISAMATALRCTVAEQEQSKTYAKPWTLALCHVAFHLEEPEHALEACIGTIVRSDVRRIEELRTSIDDDGVDEMLMSRVVMAMSESIL